MARTGWSREGQQAASPRTRGRLPDCRLPARSTATGPCVPGDIYATGMTRRLSACCLAAAAVLSLQACAGGGDPVSRLTPGEVRELTGLSAPVETAAAQQARQRELSARADSLILSTMRVEVVGPDGTHTFRWLPACAGPRCELHDPAGGETGTIGLDTSAAEPVDAEVIGSAYGITLVSETVRAMGLEEIALGAWMKHGAFGLFNDRTTGEEVSVSLPLCARLGRSRGASAGGVRGLARDHGGDADSR